MRVAPGIAVEFAQPGFEHAANPFAMDLASALGDPHQLGEAVFLRQQPHHHVAAQFILGDDRPDCLDRIADRQASLGED